MPLPQIADQPEVTCPRCGATVNVARNRQRAVMDRDLLDAARLIEVMHTLGEPVCKERISAWLKASRLTTRRYVHAGRGLVERGQKVQRKRTSGGRSVTAKPAPTWRIWAGLQRTNPGRV